jgi:hypothetical protein
MRIILQNWKLEDLISNQSENEKLTKALQLIKSRATTGSLAAYDEFDFAKLYRFMQIFRHNIDITITGNEPFPGEMLQKKVNVSLPDDIYKLLVQYYNAAYNWKFVTIETAIRIGSSGDDDENYIVVLPNVTQYTRVWIGAEIFGSTTSPRY